MQTKDQLGKYQKQHNDIVLQSNKIGQSLKELTDKQCSLQREYDKLIAAKKGTEQYFTQPIIKQIYSTCKTSKKSELDVASCIVISLTKLIKGRNMEDADAMVL